ncbi:MAG: hypothetical protein LBR79_05380 [Oscillospiraceae bacterium]|nr:hypothetical protein [Oscillospiraceae bacterium]
MKKLIAILLTICFTASYCAANELKITNKIETPSEKKYVTTIVLSGTSILFALCAIFNFSKSQQFQTQNEELQQQLNEECQALENRMAEINQPRTQNEELQLDEECQALKNRIEELQQQLDEECQALENRMAEINQPRTQNEELQQQLNNERQTLESHIEALQQQSERLRTDNRGLNAQVSLLKDDVNHARHQVKVYGTALATQYVTRTNHLKEIHAAIIKSLKSRNELKIDIDDNSKLVFEKK